MKKLRTFLFALTLSIVSIFAIGVIEASAKGDCATYIDRGYCVPGNVSSETWWTPAPQHSYGKAVWYAPYLMDATAEWRGMSLEGFEGGVAMMSPADMGQVVWLKRPASSMSGGEWEGPFLVVDVSSIIHMWTTVTQIGEVVEVDFQTALRWGMVEGNKNSYSVNEYMIRDVEVYKGLHPPFESAEAVDYVEWFKTILTWGNGNYVRWSTDDIEIFNYTQYQNTLALYLEIDLTILFTGEQRIITTDLAELDLETVIVPYSGISVSDAHHYTQVYMETVKTVSKIAWEIDCTDENPYNGFIFLDYCVPGVISRDAWLLPYPKHTIGVATFYAPGVMDTVLVNRNMSLKGYIDGIVTMTCGNIGDSAWIRRPGKAWEGPYLVVDCGGPHGIWAFTQIPLHIEVDYYRWLTWQSDGGTQSIEVCMGSNDCDGSPISWWKSWLTRQEWLLPIVDDETISPDV